MSEMTQSSNPRKTPNPPKAPEQPSTASIQIDTEAQSSSAGGSNTQHPATVPAGAQGDDKSKAKSAKDLKKEKRAAQVAARGEGARRPGGSTGGTADHPAESSGQSSARALGGHIVNGNDDVPRTGHNRATSAAATTPTVPNSTAAGTAQNAQGGSHAKRPHPLTSDASYIAPSRTSQSLFFSHLPILHQPPTAPLAKAGTIHPTVIRLGVLMATGQLRGRSARTKAMLIAFRQVIADYKSPESAVLWKDLSNHLSPMIAWLEECRPKGAGGGNAIRWLKAEINKFGEEDEDRTEAEQKEHLVSLINHYIRDRIDLAGDLIARQMGEKIVPGSIIVTYARSSLVESCLLEAWRSMKRVDPRASFEVVVVDSAPLFEGRLLVETLKAHSIPVSYTLLPTLSTQLPRCDLALLGASAVYANGSMTSRAGAAVVAMLAREYGVPVIVPVETYKFSDDTRLDGLGMNEIDFEWMDSAENRRDGSDYNAAELVGDDEDVLSIGVPAKGAGKGQGRGGNNLTKLALSYDMTPADHILSLCTEIGFIPPSSVPTVTGKAPGVA